jgi:UV DNA damage endonuclease
MALGVCCHWIEARKKPRSGEIEHVNTFDERSLQLGRYQKGKYTPDMLRGTYEHNARRLAEMLPLIHRAGVRLFRISSAMFPLADKVDEELWKSPLVKKHLATAGDYVKKHGMRVTTHPGQFCVLSSDSDAVVENAFRELSIHGWLFDAMGLDESPFYAINIHGGKADRASRLIDQIKSLPDNVRKRLTLENDESAYNVVDLLQVYQETSVPIVFDSHHHTFNDSGLTMEEAFEATKETWSKNVKPLQHISNTEPELQNGNFVDRRKHSNMIHYVPSVQLQELRDDTIDCDIECKLKNLAVFKMARDFDLRL